MCGVIQVSEQLKIAIIFCSLLARSRDHVDAHTATIVYMLQEVAAAIGCPDKLNKDKLDVLAILGAFCFRFCAFACFLLSLDPTLRGK